MSQRWQCRSFPDTHSILQSANGNDPPWCCGRPMRPVTVVPQLAKPDLIANVLSQEFLEDWLDGEDDEVYESEEMRRALESYRQALVEKLGYYL